MATVNIYKQHDPIANYILSANNSTKSALGKAGTGPFTNKRDAYVFALAIGMRIGEPTPDSDMPSKQGGFPIKEETLIVADGASELINSLWIHHHYGALTSANDMRRMLAELGSDDKTDRFALADRYAFKGFSMLDEINQSEAVSTAQQLILNTLNKIPKQPIEDPFL